MNHKIIFSSERSCKPDEGLASEIIKTNKGITPYEDTPYQVFEQWVIHSTSW